MEELGSQLIHTFAPNIDAMDEQQQLHPGKIILKVLHA
jgi:hypothetical protein